MARAGLFEAKCHNRVEPSGAVGRIEAKRDTILVAPVSEELVFRGFLYRGWSASRLGIAGTIVLTSALWAVVHQQYNWVGMLGIFSMGLTFGWLRQRSGSTALTIVLHALNNLLPVVANALIG